MVSRREFLTGAAAAVIAGPAAVKDGVAFGSMAHPMMFGALDTAVTEDFTEAALDRFMVQVRYLNGKPVVETIAVSK